MLALCAAGGLDVEHERASWPRVSEQPFDAALRRMTTLHRRAEGGDLLVCKGAPDAVAELLGDSETAVAAEAAAVGERLTEDGYRVLLVADLQASAPLHAGVGGLRMVGLVAISDSPRESARAVVADLRSAGIRTVLVTGDHAGTARSVAARLGMLDDTSQVVDGTQHDAALARGGLERVAVFARVRPEQKVAVVRGLQRAGELVAVTGDGVNDAPALRTADIGVAMGLSGTEAARQASALVLADDDLRTVVAAVEEGRRVYANIRTFLRYGLAGGLAEVLVLLTAPFLGVVVPLLPAQILWVNMLTHGLPGVAFGGEPLDKRVMRRPSRSPQESILGGGLAAQIAWTGAAIAAVCLVALPLSAPLHAHPQTFVFSILGFAQLAVALALRARVGRRHWSQRALEAAVSASLALQLLGVYLPLLNELLGTRPLPYAALGVAVGLSAGPALALRVTMSGSRASAAPG
jgi:Ca2+-transporting ATPase